MSVSLITKSIVPQNLQSSFLINIPGADNTEKQCVTFLNIKDTFHCITRKKDYNNDIKIIILKSITN